MSILHMAQADMGNLSNQALALNKGAFHNCPFATFFLP